jgi:hypothetical protein
VTAPRRGSLVLLTAALTVALTLGCARGGARAGPATSDAGRPALHFDNQAHDYVHVYLVGVRGQWLLGRVEPGARATLPIPDEALADIAQSMWLAVLAGSRATGQVAGNPRAVTTTPEPVATIVSQRWTFTPTPATGQLTSLPF